MPRTLCTQCFITCSLAKIHRSHRLFVNKGILGRQSPPVVQGGFQGAALAALEGESDATSEAISRFAKYRLERGIFTSTEAGDIRRALLASERLGETGELCRVHRLETVSPTFGRRGC